MNQTEIGRGSGGVEVTSLGTAITHCEQTADYADTVCSTLDDISDKIAAAERGLAAEATIYECGLSNVAEEGFKDKVTSYFSNAADALNAAAAALRTTCAKVQTAGEQVGVAGGQMRDVHRTLSDQLSIAEAISTAAQDGGVAARTSFYFSDGTSTGSAAPPPAASSAVEPEASAPPPVQAAHALLAAYQQGYTVEATLTGGQNARSVELVRLADGSLAVRKEVLRIESPTEVVDAYLAGLVAGALDIDHTATAILETTKPC